MKTAVAFELIVTGAIEFVILPRSARLMNPILLFDSFFCEGCSTMARCFGLVVFSAALFCLCCVVAGCSGEKASQTSKVSNSNINAESGSRDDELRVPNLDDIQQLTLGGSKSESNTGRLGDRLTPAQKMETVLDALKPLQVLIGEWRGVTQKSIGGAVSVEEPKWRRDFQTNTEQPALFVTSKTSPYFREGRLTYLIDSNEYQYTVSDRHGNERVYRGTFSEPVRDVARDGKDLQRTYKLQLNQVFPDDGNKLRQIVFNQQENNRYLLEVYNQSGSRMFRYDTVANQREGTSFALNPNDYRERECIISGGKGTSTVSYHGKSYYVCCSGCRDAFNDDPETWIVRFIERKKK
jgi:hypothetical protein